MPAKIDATMAAANINAVIFFFIHIHTLSI